MALAAVALLLAGCGDADRGAAVGEGAEVGASAKVRPKPAAEPGGPSAKPGARKARTVAAPEWRREEAESLARYRAKLRGRDLAERAGAVPGPGQEQGGGRSIGELAAVVRGTVGDETERVAALVELGGRDDGEALAVLREIATAAGRSSVERVAALEALAELPRAEHLPVVEAALAATDEEVRAAGVWLLTRMESDAAVPLWQRVMSDSAPELVALAFEALPEAPEALQTAAATAALRRGEAWMTEQALATLGGIPSKPAVEALIPMIDHPTSGDLAHDGLMFLLGESFESSSKAQRWWLANRAKLDATLQPVE